MGRNKVKRYSNKGKRDLNNYNRGPKKRNRVWTKAIEVRIMEIGVYTAYNNLKLADPAASESGVSMHVCLLLKGYFFMKIWECTWQCSYRYVNSSYHFYRYFLYSDHYGKSCDHMNCQNYFITIAIKQIGCHSVLKSHSL